MPLLYAYDSSGQIAFHNMTHFPNHRGWMYDRCYSEMRGLKEAFVIAVEEFVETARRCQYYALVGGIRSEKRLASGSNTIVHTSEIDQFAYMQEMVDNALRRHAEQEANDSHDEESPNETTQRFYNLLAEANQPVFEGSTESKLSVCIRLMACKYNWNVPNQALDFISKLSISSAQAKRFTKFRERKGLIEKDVVRTDRSILSNILRDILLTYSFYNFDLGYCQQKKQKVSEIKTGIDEAEALIRKMDLEARSLQPNVKGVLLAKLREYKSDLNNLLMFNLQDEVQFY
ncbi:Vesicle transport v-SNARE 13 [Vigna angularis]|uniref:Vesicle transport v-SNARE 13 n=1 Tax=Phaseolus angularis TaxID=3914 RepID=A0A8T0L0Y3_PHAAN|nr:Vesicle transport v-SNARE 13 [Vigna angularis]